VLGSGPGLAAPPAADGPPPLGSAVAPGSVLPPVLGSDVIGVVGSGVVGAVGVELAAGGGFVLGPIGVDGGVTTALVAPVDVAEATTVLLAVGAGCGFTGELADAVPGAELDGALAEIALVGVVLVGASVAVGVVTSSFAADGDSSFSPQPDSANALAKRAVRSRGRAGRNGPKLPDERTLPRGRTAFFMALGAPETASEWTAPAPY
jgi:hypothetical protein